MGFHQIRLTQGKACQFCQRNRATLALLGALLLAATLLLVGRLTVLASDGSPEVEIRGQVLTAPDNENGIGLWTLKTQSGNEQTVRATRSTDFKDRVPRVGNSIKVKGMLQSDNTIQASEVEIESSGGRGESEDFTGIVVSAPITTNGIGTWTIRVSSHKTRTVIADANTRLDDGVPSTGAWVEVRGVFQSDGTVLATRIRTDGHETSQVVVRLTEGVLSSTVASQFGLVPLGTLLSSANIHLFRTRDDEESHIVYQLQKATNLVVWAELNYVGGIPEGHGYKTWRWGGEDASGYVNQDAFAQVNLAVAAGKYKGDGITIAILDTGVDLAHPALVSHLVPGYDMVDDDAVPQDESDALGGGLGWGHGTHLAGIIAQMAPHSHLLPIRVLDSNGRGNTFTLAYAIDWAVDHGANVINLSLGAEANSNVLHAAIQRALDHGVLVTAAAGNLGTNAPQYPASYDGVIGVTAVDEHNVKADFASYGAGWVDLAAPGVGITSTMIGPQGSGYASWSGTSMSTAFVSGAVALARQQMPTESVNLIARQFTGNVHNIDGANPGYSGQLGGLLDVGAALVDTPGGTPTPTPTPTPTVTPTPPITGATTKSYLPLVVK
ncbi:MAG: S8 family serine peptidase [Caldilineaceae bacterium]